MYGPYLYAALTALTVAAALFVRWMAARNALTEEAREEWQDRCEVKPKTIKGVEKATFERIYISAHEPRWALYAAATLIGAVLISVPASVGLMLLWPVIVLGLDGGPWYDVGYYPWMFYMFFGMCGSWAFVGYVAARLHHQRRPESYNAALARARGEPLDDVVIPRKRPAWAKKARPVSSTAAKPNLPAENETE